MPVKILGSFLLSLAAYVVWWALENASFIWICAASLPFACGLGLLFKEVWAAYLWYALALGSSIWWLGSVLNLVVQGWPIEGVTQTIISLIPGAILLAVCLGGSFAVRRLQGAEGSN